MNRRYLLLCVLFFMVLYIGPVIFGPCDSRLAIPTEQNTSKDFQASADGDTSTDSITSFAETLADDIMYFPDDTLNTTLNFAIDYDGGPSYGSGDHESTWATYDKDSEVLEYYDPTGPPYECYTEIIFDVSGTVDYDAFNGFAVNIRATTTASSSTKDLEVYDFITTSWVDIGDIATGGLAWVNLTYIYDGDYVNSTDHLRLRVSAAGTSSAVQATIDYCDVALYFPPHESDSTHFVESFANISDWILVQGNAPTTNRDRMSWLVDGDAAWDYQYSNVPSYGVGVAYGQYLEFTAWTSDATGNTVELEIFGYTADDRAVSYWSMTSKILTETATPYKVRITSAIAQSGAFECIELAGFCSNSAAYIYIDYLRVSPANETGWGNNGTGVTCVVANGGGSMSSDGDYISLIADSDGSTFDFTIDQATTYYPMLGLSFHSGDSAEYIKVDAYNGVTLVTIIAYGTIGTATKYCNLDAAISNVLFIRLSVNALATVRLDFIKLFSLENWTYAASGVTSNDYVYVSSSVLYSNIDSGYIEYNQDPTMSVNTATYNIWNLTTGSTAPAFAYYVAGWSSYSTETRGAFASGTLTDLKLNFTTTGALSAIKFIEDSGAPIIYEVWVNPPQPDDAEPVTFTAYTYDTTDVYQVILNAVIYPAGFSDVNYYMTEETADKLWYYTFSTMGNGYYLFEITATDGDNTDVEFLPVTVIEAGISLAPISFIGAGDDFTGIQFSFDCNRAGTFSITEWTQVNESYATDAALTHTGTVIDGFNNIFWTKLTTTSSTVYFNFTIDSGSLQTNWTSTYQVAQEVFTATLTDKNNDFDRVYIQGRITKDASYGVYDSNNILRASGSVKEGSFAITFEMWNKRSLSEHDYAIKFTNGSSVDWINGTYYADSPDQYKGGGVTTALPWWQDPMTWVIIGGVLGLVYVAVSGREEGNLPNYKGAKK